MKKVFVLLSMILILFSMSVFAQEVKEDKVPAYVKAITI